MMSKEYNVGRNYLFQKHEHFVMQVAIKNINLNIR